MAGTVGLPSVVHSFPVTRYSTCRRYRCRLILRLLCAFFLSGLFLVPFPPKFFLSFSFPLRVLLTDHFWSLHPPFPFRQTSVGRLALGHVPFTGESTGFDLPNPFLRSLVSFFGRVRVPLGSSPTSRFTLSPIGLFAFHRRMLCGCIGGLVCACFYYFFVLCPSALPSSWYWPFAPDFAWRCSVL